MSDAAVAPQISRPHIPKYGIPESSEGLLPWSHVTAKLTAARNYWIATTRPDGRPHAVPVWGVFVEGTLYFGGGAHTRWSRNLDQNPGVVVHLENAEDVVIVEGTVDKLTQETADPALLVRLDDAYQAKYDIRHGTPVWRLRPALAFAWTKFPDDTTRFTFGAGEV